MHGDARAWQRVSSQEGFVPLPIQARPLAPTPQPLEPFPSRDANQQDEAVPVATDPEVVDVTADAPAERGVLVLDRHMPTATAEVGDGLGGLLKPCIAGLVGQRPVSALRPPPEQREAEKVEGTRSLAARLPRIGPLERY